MNYLIGKIVYINTRYVIIENSFKGYLINVANTNLYEINKYKKIFTYERFLLQNNHLTKELYGFSSFKEKVLFEKLMKINGIGPKIAMQILSFGIDNIKIWIFQRDLDSFKKVKGLNSKSIQAIFNEIKVEIEQPNNNQHYLDEAIEALKSLGYSMDQINQSLSITEKAQLEINEENDLSSLIAHLIKNINEHQTI